MDISAAREFLRQNHRAVLLTWHPGGNAQMSPVLVAMDDEDFAVVSTREAAIKTRNVRSNPHVALCVFTDAFFGEWVQLDGRAHVLELPDAMEHLVAYYRSVNGEHEDWDAYRSAMREERRVIVRIELTHAGPNRHG